MRGFKSSTLPSVDMPLNVCISGNADENTPAAHMFLDRFDFTVQLVRTEICFFSLHYMDSCRV